MPRGVVAAAAALVLVIFAVAARSGVLESVGAGPGETYYNLQVRGFQAGRLDLARAVPPGLAALPDPYDPVANAAYRSARYGLHDLSYYRGRLYSYFGVTPALILFWPFAAVTGRYLFHRAAVAIFCSGGFLASAGLLLGIRRRYFAGVGSGVIVAGLLLLGLASGLPLLLSRAEVYEVAISCGYLLVMLGLAAMWRCLHAEGGARAAWVAGASLAGGLAVGARPSLLPGVLILLAPACALGLRSESNRPGARSLSLLLLAALGPLALCGAGLAFYNYARFGQIAEFGQRYQLGGLARQSLGQQFSLGNLWFNLRVYFLAPVHWTPHFPFVGGITVPPLPPGHHAVEDPFGILFDTPVVWLALAAPLAWRGRPPAERSALVWLALALAWLGGSAVFVVGLLTGSCSRYEADFLPEFMLLAVLGILGLERSLAPRPVRRNIARGCWGLLLGWSIAFNLMAALEHYAEGRCDTGIVLMQSGRIPEAIAAYREALRVKPAYPDVHIDLGLALSRLGSLPEAIDQYQAALSQVPENLAARIDLGNALAQSNRLPGAITEYQRVLQLDPANVDVRYNLAHVLQLSGRPAEAERQLQEAVRLEGRR
jgi:tetratricopeptide (TPR) repeat protein